MDFYPMFVDYIRSAEKSIEAIYHHPVVFILFCGFLLWISITDYRTMKIKNYQNALLLATGIVVALIPSLGLSIGVPNLIGALVGFLFLFIPGMVANISVGGDIKFITVMGFWIGPHAIFGVMVIACIFQIALFFLQIFLTKQFTFKMRTPFGPALSIGFIVLLGICLKF